MRRASITLLSAVLRGEDLDDTERLPSGAAWRLAESMIRLLRCAPLWDSLLADPSQIVRPCGFQRCAPWP
jgi:hypothetical protein